MPAYAVDRNDAIHTPGPNALDGSAKVATAWLEVHLEMQRESPTGGSDGVDKNRIPNGDATADSGEHRACTFPQNVCIHSTGEAGMTRQTLAGKTAIITGASSGIGRSAALLFAREGARLVIGARSADALAELVDEIERAGGVAIACPGDVRESSHNDALVDTTLTRFGRLDIAFNNAGGTGTMAPAVDMEVSDWRDTIDTNLTAMFLGARRQMAAMLEAGRGSIIFTSSFVGHTVGLPGMAAYAAAKAGVIGLTQVLAAEGGLRGVRVNALLPGGTDTPGARDFTVDPDSRAFVEGMHALKRIADPAEIAEAALFLASDASSFVTGSAMRVDGGVSINRT
ncbi:SDR family oxidoreductase [Luteimonas sp. 3794]|uniref:SDR family oxidoreductase n=1 Tax=Luteimonas sp. 3794 TaxID=2817730 RepID=UPI00285E746B|nr:SDR family oxidoreductase [Luteimonas sp. 3794]MDR6990955.1 NAD(P)-dependent dehydrogenase (short-subunit alcohol dehydrogenase family) [Luteimonas sp. 3794]